MNPVRLIWWRVLDDARFGVRFVCTRFRSLAAVGVVSRWVFHVMAGNVGHVVVAFALLALLSAEAAFLVWLLAAAIFEVWFQVGFATGSGSWVHGWRLWWRVRRSIAGEWNESAVKSKPIKSVLGGEDSSAQLLRPVADHPKTAWFPRIEWPVVSAWVGHPPGRSSAEYSEFQATLAANILRVDNIEFDFDRSRDSIGRLQITFVDVLQTPVVPSNSKVNLRLVTNNDQDEAV